MTKAALRQLFLDKRRQLDAGEYRRLNELLCQNFITHIDISTVQYLHTFLPLAKNKEPDTWAIIRWIQELATSIHIVLPRIASSNGNLESVLLDNNSELQPNPWGIEEPVNGQLIEPTLIDMVLVPMLAFDRQGNRVGYGKGFYDKFLSQCKPTCRRIGLAFYEPVDLIEDTDQYDQKLDEVVTPGGYYAFA